MSEVIIVGAGLSGLTAAYHLKKRNIPFRILEARNRLGGRIDTIEGPIEMGATWFGGQHIHLRQFLSELQIDHFEQFTKGKISYDLHSQAPAQYMDMPAGQPPSFRIKGGTYKLIERLSKELMIDQIQLNTQIKRIEEKPETLLLTDTKGNTYEASFVIATIPPQLLAYNVDFEPALPTGFMQLLKETHTWMNESIKFALSYNAPFWKEKGMSGMGFGQVGPIQEVHDHTDAENQLFALKGFLNPALADLSETQREDMVKAQLMKLFGPEAGDYISYYDRVWINESFTSVKKASPLMPHQNSGHPSLSKLLMRDRLILGGTETSPAYGGYMDGAVYAGIRAAQQIERLMSTLHNS